MNNTKAQILDKSLNFRLQKFTVFIFAFFQKSPVPQANGFPDYQDIEIITAPPPDVKKGFGQSFEVKVRLNVTNLDRFLKLFEGF